MTQEQLAYIVDRAPRTIMYNENDGQHPSLIYSVPVLKILFFLLKKIVIFSDLNYLHTE